jgi:hypothetical protein
MAIMYVGACKHTGDIAMCRLQESWSQLPAVLAWFSSAVLQLQHTAKLSFPPCLAKELRADVHK